MSVGVEALFTSALGLQVPWVVEEVKLDTVQRRIDFEIGCQGTALACPACGASAQPVHDRLRRSWRHLDFFQFEAWLHCDVPRIACASCGKTTQAHVPWARPGSGFTAAFEALALAVPGVAGVPGGQPVALCGQVGHTVTAGDREAAAKERARLQVGHDGPSPQRPGEAVGRVQSDHVERVHSVRTTEALGGQRQLAAAIEKALVDGKVSPELRGQVRAMMAAEGAKRVARGERFKVPVYDARAPRARAKTVQAGPQRKRPANPS